MSQPTWDNIKEKAGEAAHNTAQAAKSSLPWFSTFECKVRVYPQNDFATLS